NRQTAIDSTAASVRFRCWRIRKRPENAAGDGVERVDIVGRLDSIENAIDHQRGGLELLDGASLPDPLQLEILHIRGSDLRQRAISLAADRSGIGEPILGFLIGVQDAIKRDTVGAL